MTENKFIYCPKKNMISTNGVCKICPELEKCGERPTSNDPMGAYLKAIEDGEAIDYTTGVKRKVLSGSGGDMVHP